VNNALPHSSDWTLTIRSSDLGYTLLSQPLLLLRSPSSFRSKWFERFFAFLGPRFAASPVQIGYIEFVMSQAHGIILELGPGNGDQTFHFKANKIEKIYGAEPNEHFHPALIAKAKESGMDGKYVAIKAGAQPVSLLPALKDAGLLPRNMANLPEGGVFDSIVMIKSMCSVPQIQLPETMEVMRALLKPNGQLLFFEHLRNEASFFSQCYGGVLSAFLWPALMGGCRLDGKLDKVVLGMNGWKSKKIENIREFKGHEVIRYATGVCTKA
jgi:SAM-dependent methyltransferase